MNPTDIETKLRNYLCEQVHLYPEGENRYRVFTPYRFEDGDHLVIVLREIGGSWLLSDEGHTFMHLTYEISDTDLQRGNRQRIISDALNQFGVRDEDGQLIIEATEEGIGAAFYNYVQALLRISDVTLLSREIVRSTFIDDFRLFFGDFVPEGRRHFDWYDRNQDPGGNYQVTCRIDNSRTPLFVFAIGNDDHAQVATISLYKFDSWGLQYQSLGVFQRQEDINRRVLARFSDVCDKLFSSLVGNADRITQHVTEVAHLQRQP